MGFFKTERRRARHGGRELEGATRNLTDPQRPHELEAGQPSEVLSVPLPQLRVLGLLADNGVLREGVAEVIHHGSDGEDAAEPLVQTILWVDSLACAYALSVPTSTPRPTVSVSPATTLRLVNRCATQAVVESTNRCGPKMQHRHPIWLRLMMWRLFSLPDSGAPTRFASSCNATTSGSTASPARWSRTTARLKTWFSRRMSTPSAVSAASEANSSLPTWLTRITLNEALGRLRRQRPIVDLEVLDADFTTGRSQVIPFPLMSESADPERAAAQSQIRRLIERAIDDLPEIFRVVFVMRDVEDMSIEETADFLGLPPATVKTRLHRARRQLRRALDETLASTLTEAFPFDGKLCQRMTDKVLQRLQLAASSHN